MRTRMETGAPLALAAIPLLILAAVTVSDAAGGSTRPKTWTWSFQADTLGQEPQR